MLVGNYLFKASIILCYGFILTMNSFFHIRDGFEKIWRNIVKKENLQIKFNQIVYSIRRKYDRVLLKIQSGSSLDVVRCDFLIWGGPINPEFLRYVYFD